MASHTIGHMVVRGRPGCSDPTSGTPERGVGDRASRRPRPTLSVLELGALTGLVALTIVVVVHPAPLPIDRAALSWSRSHRTPVLGAVRALTWLGTTWVLAPLLLLAGLPLALRDRRWWLGLVGPALLFAGQLTRYLMTTMVGRPRPPVAVWATTASGMSFPSGHATNAAFGCGLVILLTRPALRSRTLRRVVGAAAVVATVTVGATRVLLGVHWTSDVIAGWALAVIMLVVAAGALKRVQANLPAAPPKPPLYRQ
jgi:membrane-associated phospholipid phosphatase